MKVKFARVREILLGIYFADEMNVFHFHFDIVL
jgi:hypothetical protein